MVVRDIESWMPHGVTASDLGEATAEQLCRGGERFILYPTSPVAVPTKLDYVLLGRPTPGSNEDLWLEYAAVANYKLTVLSADDPSFFVHGVTAYGCWSWTVDDWKSLIRRQQVEIFNHLRFPKSNIALCARLLTRINERANRAQGLPAGDVAADPKLVGLIATEFQAGATTSSFADAKAPDGNTNGERAIQYVKNDSVRHPELYFP
jgi:hypothetical protein